jgi:hypothetical protein
MVNRVQKMRMTGETRKAFITGRQVMFARLSPSCKVNVTWNFVYRRSYKRVIDAMEAKIKWEKDMVIL